MGKNNKKWVKVNDKTFIEVDKDADPEVAVSEYLQALKDSGNTDLIIKSKKDGQTEKKD